MKMQESNKLKSMLYFTILYMVVFTVIALVNANYEFLYYTAFMLILIILVVFHYRRFELKTSTLFWLTLLGALHIFGGNVYIDSIRLYDFWLIPGILRYDNLVHIMGGLAATLVAYHLLYYRFHDKILNDKFMLALILLLMACGVGAIYEVIELTAVLWFNAASKVGDYFNNAFDLLFNLIGAVVGCFYLIRKR
jgi:uncharacterized membrane protein YjdF